MTHKEALKLCSINPDAKIIYPPIALSLGSKVLDTRQGKKVVDIPIATYSNISAIGSPPKTKKTFLTSLLVSAYLHHNQFSGKIKTHRKDHTVLHFDTEQGEYHASRVFNRVLDMANLDFKEAYKCYALRVLSPKQRIDFIEKEIAYNKNVGLVIIDGITDLVADINNIEESNLAVHKLMEWSGKYKCHIMTVIHTNYNSDKITGHLGSILLKKLETLISLEQINDEVKVNCKLIRGFSFESFNFKINSFGYPEICDNYYDPLREDFPKTQKLG